MSTAEDFIQHLRSVAIITEAHLKGDEYYRLWYGGAFGILQLADIRGSGGDILTMTVIGEYDGPMKLVTTVSQCSVQFEVFVPEHAQEVLNPRVVLGFSDSEDES
jgi:hypothetical protein